MMKNQIHFIICRDLSTFQLVEDFLIHFCLILIGTI